jgi:hypothetical protein
MSTIFGVPLVALDGAGIFLLLGFLSSLGTWWLNRRLLRTRRPRVLEKPTLLHESMIDVRALPTHSALYTVTDERMTTVRCSTSTSSTVRTARVSYMNLPKGSEPAQRPRASVHGHFPKMLATTSAQLPGTWTMLPVHIPPTTSRPASR